MSAALQAAAATFMLARANHKRAMAAFDAAGLALKQAEKDLVETIVNDDSEGGVAFAHDGTVFILREDYWDLPDGEKIQVEKLIGGAPC